MTEVEKLLEHVEAGDYSHVIFDLDATLTLLNLPWEEWVRLICERVPAEQATSFQKILDDSGSGWQEFANAHIERYDGFLEALIAASEEFERTYFAHTPYDELVKAVHTLAEQGKTLYVWSANMRSTIEHALLELGIRQHFAGLVTREDTRLSKPDPAGWTLIDDGTPRGQYLFVGDSSNDKGAAQAIGIDYFEIRYFKQDR